MIQFVEPEGKALPLDYYAEDAKFVNAVSDLRAVAAQVVPRLQGRTIWMINSTAQGGGVAEMLPRMLSLMGDLGVSVRWAVITSEDPEFFRLTKRIHNLIHGDTRSGMELGTAEARLHEAVNRVNAESLEPHLGPGDILVVHDPQPMPLGQMLAKQLDLPAIWRCHIGLDSRSEATRAAWRYLRQYADGYDQAVFSASEYIPSFLSGRSTIIHPALDPISHKNRDLSVSKLVGVLCNSGLQQAHQPVPTPDYEHQVQRVTPDGGTAVPGEMGLLFRPTILQVSRWDRLKGWLPLLEGFARMKHQFMARENGDLRRRNRRRLEQAQLVLAGPDPSSIADDPEGLDVLEQIKQAYRSLVPELQRDVALLLLPMASRKHNALIVNALQRCATLVVQNSLREGFGLTVTEAMWKHLAVLGSQACGIRQQIRDGVDGVLVQDPEDPDEIAARLRELLVHPRGRYSMGRAAQRRVYDEFLVFRQIARYLTLLGQLI